MTSAKKSFHIHIAHSVNFMHAKVHCSPEAHPDVLHGGGVGCHQIAPWAQGFHVFNSNESGLCGLCITPTEWLLSILTTLLTGLFKEKQFNFFPPCTICYAPCSRIELETLARFEEVAGNFAYSASWIVRSLMWCGRRLMCPFSKLSCCAFNMTADERILTAACCYCIRKSRAKLLPDKFL